MLSLPTDRFCSKDCSEVLFCSGGIPALDSADGFGSDGAFSLGFEAADFEAAVALAASRVEPRSVPSAPVVLLPKVEKFHFPEGERSSMTCGFVKVMSVM